MLTDTELIIERFCVPSELDEVCYDMSGWDVDDNNNDWCCRHCGEGNAAPRMECYKEWLKMKRSEDGA